MSSITGNSLRLISQELLDDLEHAFRVPDIKHDTPETQIKWAAAQREVIEWLKAKAGLKQSTGPISYEAGRPMPTGAIVRVGQ